MQLNPKAAAIPYIFTPEEIKTIQDTFNNPLIIAFLQATRSNIMTERFGFEIPEGSLESATTAILINECMCQGQIYLLDGFTRVAAQLSHTAK